MYTLLLSPTVYIFIVIFYACARPLYFFFTPLYFYFLFLATYTLSNTAATHVATQVGTHLASVKVLGQNSLNFLPIPFALATCVPTSCRRIFERTSLPFARGRRCTHTCWRTCRQSVMTRKQVGAHVEQQFEPLVWRHLWQHVASVKAL